MRSKISGAGSASEEGDSTRGSVLAGDGYGIPEVPYAGTVSSFFGPYISTPLPRSRGWLQAAEAELLEYVRAKRRCVAVEWRASLVL